MPRHPPPHRQHRHHGEDLQHGHTGQHAVAPAGTTVLTARQLFDLGTALTKIHTAFSAAYGPAAGNNGFYGLEVDFKFDDELTPGTPALYIKQARPYPDPFASQR